MAIAMSLVMSLVQTLARLGFTPSLASAWLTSFAIGVAVAIPTAILVAPRAQRLASHLTARTAPLATASRPTPRHILRELFSQPAGGRLAPQTTGTQESR